MRFGQVRGRRVISNVVYKIMNVLKELRKATIIQIISSLFGVLILLIGSIYSEVLPVVFPIMIQQMPKTLLLKLLLLAIALFFLSVGLTLAVYLTLKTKLVPKCGVLWDRNREAYCPACEIILSEYWEEQSPGNPVCEFKCIKGNHHIRLMHLGKNISLKDARKLIK